MTKHLPFQSNLLVVLLATGLSAACMSDPVAGTSEPDAGPPSSPEVDAKVGITPDTASAVCGNALLEFGETCDDGNTLGLDGCSANCIVEPGIVCPVPGEPCTAVSICGNGKVDPGEQCDDGINDGHFGGCAPGCTFGPYCGDGILQADHEQCDFGAANGSLGGCNRDCTLTPYVPESPYCGDGILQTNTEQCDDGNTLSGDGCSATCQVEPCWATCSCNGSTPCGTPGAVCGNGVLEAGESCDDGNLQGWDGCSAKCQIESGWTCRAPGGPCVSVCGDGVLASNEQCDDGNTQSGDGCSATCQIEAGWGCGPAGVACMAWCGDGVVSGNEACDLGESNGKKDSGCAKDCTIVPSN